MTLLPELMKAILSMDAYNRGYDAGLSYLSSETVLGNTSINYTSSTLLDENNQPLFDDTSIGFYAVSYQYDSDGDGMIDETVISYRGTDDFSDWAVTDPLTDDMYHGWSLGNGNTDSEQGRMAAQFYRAVDDEVTTTISFTGHSLGGGLAVSVFI